jgi:hypothetical protein
MCKFYRWTTCTQNFIDTDHSTPGKTTTPQIAQKMSIIASNNVKKHKKNFAGNGGTS